MLHRRAACRCTHVQRRTAVLQFDVQIELIETAANAGELAQVVALDGFRGFECGHCRALHHLAAHAPSRALGFDEVDDVVVQVVGVQCLFCALRGAEAEQQVEHDHDEAGHHEAAAHQEAPTWRDAVRHLRHEHDRQTRADGEAHGEDAAAVHGTGGDQLESGDDQKAGGVELDRAQHRFWDECQRQRDLRQKCDECQYRGGDQSDAARGGACGVGQCDVGRAGAGGKSAQQARQQIANTVGTNAAADGLHVGAFPIGIVHLVEHGDAAEVVELREDGNQANGNHHGEVDLEDGCVHGGQR